MKRLLPIALTSSALLCFTAGANANLLLDDHFSLGNRTNQNLPSSSRWFANSVNTLTNAVGNMTWVVPSSSCLGITYFMPPGNPSALNIGDTLKLTLTFSNLGVNVGSTTINGPRIGLFNYSAGATRINQDGFSTSSDGVNNAANVQGYALFMNFSQTNGLDNPVQIRKRTTTSDPNLLSAGGDYTSLASGGGSAADPAFSNNVVYTMVFSITRTNTDAVVITNSFTGPGLNKLVVAADTSGAVTNFDAFALRPPGSGNGASNHVFTELKIEGPPGLLTPASIVGDPQDVTLTVSDFGIFSAAAGALPIGYQWYFNNVATPLAGQTNLNLVLLNIQPSQAGQYFIVASNAQGSATSAVANLTVTTPTHTPRGLLVDDTFQNPSRVVSTVTTSNSDWLSSVDSVLSQPNIPGTLVGNAQTNTSTLWVGNFLSPSASAPVDLDVGDALRVTMVFNPTNPAAQNTGSLRFGIFDFYDGSRVLQNDGNLDLPSWNGGGGGTNARGYMVTVNFGTSFGDGTPIGLYVRNNLPSTGLMASTGDFQSLGSGPSGLSNAPAFLSGGQYTLQVTAARVATTALQVSARVTGPQLNNLGFLTTDTTYFTHRFSGFAIRPNRTTDSADTFSISEFKVEVIAATNASVAPFSITTEGSTTSTNFFLTWNSVPGTFYHIESTTNLAPPVVWTTNTSLAASGASASWTNLNTAGTNAFPPSAQFFRVVAPVQPAP